LYGSYFDHVPALGPKRIANTAETFSGNEVT
jgi:hypothetical protein